MAIPSNWEYRKIDQGFFKKKKMLPVAWICRDYGQVQCLCPNCDYARGYNKTIILGTLKPQVAICKTCGTEFIALVTTSRLKKESKFRRIFRNLF